jgi:hypothetical protein
MSKQGKIIKKLNEVPHTPTLNKSRPKTLKNNHGQIKMELVEEYTPNGINKTRKFRPVKCSPKQSNELNNFTCYTDESLIKLRDYWNSRHPDHLITSNNSRDIWKHLKKYMDKVCDTESCWLRQKFIINNLDNELLNYTFSPKQPSSWKSNKNTWLTSIEIEQLMKQYEHAFPCFAFIGPSPIDFDSKKLYDECVWEELCKFDLNEYLKRGKTKIGIIFNTDPHYKDGSHWIAMYIDVRKKFIFYFDSNGNVAPNEIKALQSRIKDQGSAIGINFIVDENAPLEHQKGNSECGMYSMYFIIQLLTDNKTIEYFKTHRIPDSEMEKLRNEYFNSDL